MKNMIFYAVLFISFNCFCQTSNDSKNISGYGKTSWGMTPEQVLNAEPRANKLNKYKEYTDDKLGLLSIDSINLDGEKFKTIFIFDKTNKLRRVELENENDSLGMCLNDNTFSSIEKLLTEKYGIPTFKNPHLENDLARDQATWKLTNTTIELISICRHGGPFSYITIKYKPSINESGDL
jgi:hypothetical protein